MGQCAAGPRSGFACMGREASPQGRSKGIPIPDRARHNAHQLPEVLEMARRLGADALHTFLLVPVGCGVDIAEDMMVPPEEYERMLNWFYDQSLSGDIELKAACAPHYFRVSRRRRAADGRAGKPVPAAPIAHHPPGHIRSE